ncbi:hypothetical protein GCM10007907_40220 [Chitinimonas prasina]|uniref:Bifunctional diguanylate cyclase/phosphodiesterase n=1 Tax=Chitinimonas prasina TaxID=1434937 RepID=A0ABQ5YL28_9NEIS|nr:EAL domain-containing protein [Chitinimonas prasina]GLR15232.1 hypothetical protein GCM10007907_40220 [Chitinimonas prasina]
MMLLIALLIGGLAWLLWRTAVRQNEVAVAAEQALVMALLDASKRQLPASLSDYALWDDMYAKVGMPAQPDLAWFDDGTTETIHTKLKIDLMLLAEGDRRVLRLMLRGELRDGAEFELDRLPAWRALLSEARAAAAGKEVSRDLRWGDHAYWVTALRVQPQDVTKYAKLRADRVLVFARKLDVARVADVLSQQRLDGLTLRREPVAGGAYVALTQVDGVQGRYVVWWPKQSGSAFVHALLVPAGLLVMLILLLGWGLLRDARLRQRALSRAMASQAQMRAANVALVALTYAHHHGSDATDADYWQRFAITLGKAIRAQRVSLLRHDAQVDTALADIDIASQSAWPGPAGPQRTNNPRLLAQEYLMLEDAPQARARAAVIRGGRLVGEVLVEREAGTQWLQDEGNFLVAAAALVALSLETSSRRDVERHLHKQVYFDPLTGLSSALRLSEELLLRRQDWSGMVVVAVLRLEELEDINLLYGREAGDTVLRTTAARLSAVLQADELAARSGGKRFDLLLYAGQAASGHARLSSLLVQLTEPIMVGTQQFRPQCRVGAVLCEAKELGAARLQEACLALDQAQQGGRDRLVWYDQTLRALAERRLALLQALRRALVQGGLSLAYQPFVDAASRQPVGAEVLLRWRDSEFGVVSPAEFVPLAEEGGLILELGDWVMETAMAQLQQWQSQLPVPLRLAINLSPRQLEDEKLAIRLFAAMARHQVTCSAVEFEVTEGLALETSTAITANLQAFQAADIDIAIDDFGTGYATFSFLRRYKVQKIKLDKLFIDGLHDHSTRLLVRSMITMASGLGAQVTAEGVEQDAQWRMLQDMGCDYIQGYFFARPMPAEDFTAWVVDQQGQ